MSIRRGNRPTIDDVARESGVSRGTVSRVLNGGHWVSPEARDLVERAILATGYRVNPHARSLATSRAGSIGFLLSASYERFLADPNSLAILRSCGDALAAEGMTMLMILADGIAERRRASAFVAGGHVDGVLVLSSHRDAGELLEAIVDAGLPAVAAGVPLGYEDRVAYVTADDRSGARDLLAHLAATGRSRIAHLAGPLDTSGGLERLAAYREHQEGRGAEPWVIPGDYSRESGAVGMTELLDRGVGIDAVFCANDLMAAGALDVLHARGVEVPATVAVAGFDDSPLATATAPPLTTVRQPFEQLSREMVGLLMARIAGEPVSHLTLGTELVVRGSA